MNGNLECVDVVETLGYVSRYTALRFRYGTTQRWNWSNPCGIKLVKGLYNVPTHADTVGAKDASGQIVFV